MTTFPRIAALTALFAFSPFQFAAAPQESAGTAGFEAVAEQVEIMSRVLARALNERLTALSEPDSQEEGEKNEGGRAVDLQQPVGPAPAWALEEYYDAARKGIRTQIFTSHTRGFYAPGVGAVFSTNVRTPTVVVKDESQEPEVQPTKEDPWEAARRELRDDTGGESPSDAAEPKQIVQALHIDSSISAAIDCLASYGVKLTDVDDDEVIVVSLRFIPSSGFTSRKGLVLRGLVVNAASPRQTVIQIKKRDLDRFADGSIDSVELRERAVITSYDVPVQQWTSMVPGPQR